MIFIQRKLANYLQAKSDYIAGMATYSDGSRHLVAAGGYYIQGQPIYDINTWIYDLDLGIDQWRPGPDIPIERASSVQFKDSFLVVGGGLNEFPYDETNQIWQFNADASDERWILRPETMKRPKYWAAAFLVPNDYATC